MEAHLEIKIQEVIIEDQRLYIKECDEEIAILRRSNLQLKEHMKVLVMHPVGLASKMIANKYAPEKVTRELQLSSQN